MSHLVERRCVWCNPPHVIGHAVGFNTPESTDGMCEEAMRQWQGKSDGKRCPVCNLRPCFCEDEKAIEKDERERHDKY